MTCPDFVAWLESHLLSDDSTSQPAPFAIPSSYDTPPPSELTRDKVVEVMWGYVQQYSSRGVLLPCCAVLTTTKVIVEKMCVAGPQAAGGSRGGEITPHLPDLRPCTILPLGNLQHGVVGPSHAYLRLEEAFVGKSGLFTLYAVNTAALSRFADILRDCCDQLDINTPFDVLDLSDQSDLLRELRRREEERLGVTSSCLTFVSLVRMKVKGRDPVTPILLVLSQNVVYFLDTSCVYWPPATFELAHEGNIHLQALREVSIYDIKVLDVDTDQSSTNSNAEGDKVSRKDKTADKRRMEKDASVSEFPPLPGTQTDFTPSHLTVQTPSPAGEDQDPETVHLQFSSSSACNTFLSHLACLQAHQNKLAAPFVREREAPEGGNETVGMGDGHFNIPIADKPAHFHSSPGDKPKSLTSAIDTNMAAQNQTQNNSGLLQVECGGAASMQSQGHGTTLQAQGYSTALQGGDSNGELNVRAESGSKTGMAGEAGSGVVETASPASQRKNSVTSQDIDCVGDVVDGGAAASSRTAAVGSSGDLMVVETDNSNARPSFSVGEDVNSKPTLSSHVHADIKLPVSDNVGFRPTIPASLVSGGNHPASSLPSSYEYKGFGFGPTHSLLSVTAPWQSSHRVSTSAYSSAQETSVYSGETSNSEYSSAYLSDKDMYPGATESSERGGVSSQQGEGQGRLSVKVEVYVGRGLPDIQSSGEYEESDSAKTIPTQLEQDLRASVRTYTLLHSLPSRMRPLSLMTGKELVTFFLSKIAGTPSSSSSTSSSLSPSATASASEASANKTITRSLR
jgi:hypothetical protein